MPSRRPKQPDLIPVRIPTPEEAALLPPLPKPIELPRDQWNGCGLWQTWDRDRGGWTHALRLTPHSPLGKFAVSAGKGDEEDPHSWSYYEVGFWVVEEGHPAACDMWGEEGELGLGMGSPYLEQEFESDPIRTNRDALSYGRDRVLDALSSPEYYAALIAKEGIYVKRWTSGQPLISEYEVNESLLEFWEWAARSDNEYTREGAIAQAWYVARTCGEEKVTKVLGELGFTGHELIVTLEKPKYEPEAVAA